MERITTESISEMTADTVTDEEIREMIRITSEEPNDLLRVFARVWLQENAIKLLKRHYE